ncbi:MAG: gas vesicle protein [Actinobacteria bacterium]|nr:gas vesicle protein [Actinomycetota bacterium]
MAEERPRRRRRASGGGRSDGAPRRRTAKRASGVELAKRAKDQLAEITGLAAESVSALERAEDGSWFVTVDLLELSRIPETDDVLGSYEAQLDADGELLSYKRLRRYPRSQAQESSNNSR